MVRLRAKRYGENSMRQGNEDIEQNLAAIAELASAHGEKLGGDAIRVGHGSVWLSNLRQGNVWRLDPKRIEATRP
jgi:hypothetical protein